MTAVIRFPEAQAATLRPMPAGDARSPRPQPRAAEGCAPGEVGAAASPRARSAAGATPAPTPGSPPGAREADALRAVRIGARSLHLVSFGGLFGEAVHTGAVDAGGPWVAATVLSGGLLAALELAGGRIWLVQVRGLLTYVKVALLALALARPASATACLLAAILVGGVSSHMPGRFRYHSIVHGGPRGPRDRG